METNEYLKEAVLNGWGWELCPLEGPTDHLNYRFFYEENGQIKEVGIFTLTTLPEPDWGINLGSIRVVIEGYIIKTRLGKIDSIIGNI